VEAEGDLGETGFAWRVWGGSEAELGRERERERERGGGAGGDRSLRL
jgi:hypothetical protein